MPTARRDRPGSAGGLCGGPLDRLHLGRVAVAHEVTVAGGGSPDDVGAAPAGELNGEAANPARSTVNQHPLPGREPRVVEESLPGRQGGERGCRGARMVEAAGFRAEVGGAHGDVLGRSPVPEKIDQPIDGIADRHISLRGQVFAASPSWPRRGDLPRSTTCCIQSYGLGVARHPLRATSKQSGCKIGCSRENAEER
jgi:hypothetical protein